MAGVVSKLSEREMLLIYFARAMHEYLGLPRKTYWSDVLARSGVTNISPNELYEWSKWNLTTQDFVCDGVKGLMRHLRKKRMDPRRSGLFSRAGCQEILYGSDNLKLPEAEGNLKSYADDEYDNCVTDVKTQCEGIISHYEACMFFLEDILTFGLNPLCKETYGFWKKRSDTAEIIAETLHQEDLMIVDKLLEDDWWNQFLTPDNSSVEQLKLDTLAPVAYHPHYDFWDHRPLPDNDQYCAVFISYYLLYKYFSFGILFQNENRNVVRNLIDDCVKSGYLSCKRSVDEWYKWFVNELFHNTSGCDYFNVNASALCHLQYEVLRSGRGDNYAGISKLKRLEKLLKKGSGYDYDDN